MKTESITLPDGQVISRKEYCKLRAKDYAAAYPKAEPPIIWNYVDNLIEICDTGRDLTEEEEDRVHPFTDLLELTCRELEDSRKRESGELALSLPIIEPEVVEGDSEQLALIEAARASSLESGAYQEVREIFEFSPGMRSVQVKEGHEDVPINWAKLLGIGFRMKEGGEFLMAQSVARLKAYGRFNECLEQISADFRLAPSTLYGYAIVAQRTPAQYQTLPFTVLSEITRAKLDKDPKKDEEKRLQLLQEATESAWDSAEARSHVKMAQGKEEKPQRPSTPQYLCILNGEYWLSDDQPAIEPGLIMCDLKNLERLEDYGTKVHMIPIDRR